MNTVVGEKLNKIAQEIERIGDHARYQGEIDVAKIRDCISELDKVAQFTVSVLMKDTDQKTKVLRPIKAINISGEEYNSHPKYFTMSELPNGWIIQTRHVQNRTVMIPPTAITWIEYEQE